MIIPHRRNRPNIGGPITCLTLGMVVPTSHRERLAPTNLTTMQVTDRCDDCAWPKICAKDETCWHQEKHAEWHTSRPVIREVKYESRRLK